MTLVLRDADETFMAETETRPETFSLETETLENSSETRRRVRLETETSRPRLHPWYNFVASAAMVQPCSTDCRSSLQYYYLPLCLITADNRRHCMIENFKQDQIFYTSSFIKLMTAR